jgi:hypothetical protein
MSQHHSELMILNLAAPDSGEPEIAIGNRLFGLLQSVAPVEAA